MSQDNLNLIYSYFHSHITCGIIFWGNSSHINIFRLQKRIIRITTGSKLTQDFCRQLFKNLGISPRQQQYLYPYVMFVVNNRYYYLQLSFYLIYFMYCYYLYLFLVIEYYFRMTKQCVCVCTYKIHFTSNTSPNLYISSINLFYLFIIYVLGKY